MNNRRKYLIFDYSIMILFTITLTYSLMYKNIQMSILAFVLLAIERFALIPYFKDVYKKPHLTIIHSLIIVITLNLYLGLIFSESILIKYKYIIFFTGILIYTIHFMYQIKSNNK